MTIEEFIAARLPALTRTALALSGDIGLAEDLVQEVLIKANASWDRVNAASAPDAYVRRMLVNEFISWRRKWGRIVPVADVRTSNHTPDHADGIGLRSSLDAHVSQLPRRQQAALALRFYDDLDIGEIADALDCRPGTVRSLLSRALATLRIDQTLRDEFELVCSDRGRDT